MFNRGQDEITNIITLNAFRGGDMPHGLPVAAIKGKGDTDLVVGSKIALITFATLTYCSMLNDRTDMLRYRVIWRAVTDKNWSDMFARLPLWMPVLLIAAFAAIACEISMYQGAIAQPTTMRLVIWITPNIESIKQDNHWAILLLLLRDILIVNFMHFGSPEKSSNRKILVYLLILYTIMPLLIPTGEITAHSIFWPIGPMATKFAFVQVIIATLLLVWRISRIRATSSLAMSTSH